MPIAPHLRHFYRGTVWRNTRTAVLQRARGRCEQCGKPNHAILYVFAGRDGKGRRIQYWLKQGRQLWRSSPSGQVARHFRIVGLPRKLRVILTCAHLNHQPGDDRLENLRALCQWCHLNYDLFQHHETRARRKDAARPLLNL